MGRRVRTSDSMNVPKGLAQDAQRDMARLRSEDRINREAKEADDSRKRVIAFALPYTSSAMKCNACGQLGHRRTTHSDCLRNPQRLLVAEYIAKANAPPTGPSALPAPATPATPATPAPITSPATPATPATPAPPATPTAPAAPAAPAALADPSAPAAPSAPSAPAAPAAPATPAELDVFENGMTAFKRQDGTKYRTLGRIDVVCPHRIDVVCPHCIDVMISVTICNMNKIDVI